MIVKQVLLVNEIVKKKLFTEEVVRGICVKEESVKDILHAFKKTTKKMRYGSANFFYIADRTLINGSYGVSLSKFYDEINDRYINVSNGAQLEHIRKNVLAGNAKIRKVIFTDDDNPDIEITLDAELCISSTNEESIDKVASLIINSIGD